MSQNRTYYMKSRVRLSGYCVAVTCIITGVLAGLLVFTFDNKPAFYSIIATLALIYITSAIYAPLSIKVDAGRVTVRSLLKSHSIPLDQVRSVELFQPTMGATRLLGSGGFLGYWGLYREGDIGRYKAWYGRASDCFLLRMRDGGQYVLGCDFGSETADCIRRQLRH